MTAQLGSPCAGLLPGLLQRQEPYIVDRKFVHTISTRGKGGSISVRDQERRAREAARKADEVVGGIERRTRAADRQAKEAMLRAEEVRRRIEVGDEEVKPRPLPSLREDSMESMESMKSMESIGSMKSMGSANKLDEEAEGESYGQEYGQAKNYGEEYGRGQDYGGHYGKDR